MVDTDATLQSRFLVIGILGIGKSTLLNTLMGDEAAFKAGRSVKGVTSEAMTQETEHAGRTISLTDVPGLFDLRYPLPVWLNNYGRFEHDQKTITKVLWVIRSVVRPTD